VTQPLEAWADIDDVDTFTGVTVTEDDIIRAQDIIEIFTGTTWLATDQISERNLRLLNRAVAYQTAWMISRPDLYTHFDVDTVSQDGASFTPATVNAQLLAPLAARCLRRLTWAWKPLRVRRGYNQPDYLTQGARDSAVADDSQVWTPM
jgi:hypothetical protein